MKLTILGGGGFRVPLVHRALLAQGGTAGPLPCTELVLHDTDPARAPSSPTCSRRTRTGCRTPRGYGSPRGLDDALRGADVVFCAMRVGGTAGRVRDERVPLAEGVLGQETVGAGGVLYGLRTVPVALHVAERVRELAPGAWVINFTNPAGMVTEAMARVLGARVIGICDSPVGLVRRAARAAGADPDAVRYDYLGLNHLGWLRSLEHEGRDLLPDLLADDAALGAFEEGRLFGGPWLRALGALPNEYLHYYYFRRETLAAVREAAQTRGEFLERAAGRFFADAAGAGPRRAAQLWERTRLEREETYMADSRAASGGWQRDACDLEGGGYEQVALAVMGAVTGDTGRELILNVRNGTTVRGAAGRGGHRDGVHGRRVRRAPAAVPAAGTGGTRADAAGQGVRAGHDRGGGDAVRVRRRCGRWRCTRWSTRRRWPPGSCNGRPRRRTALGPVWSSAPAPRRPPTGRTTRNSRQDLAAPRKFVEGPRRLVRSAARRRIAARTRSYSRDTTTQDWGLPRPQAEGKPPAEGRGKTAVPGGTSRPKAGGVAAHTNFRAAALAVSGRGRATPRRAGPRRRSSSSRRGRCGPPCPAAGSAAGLRIEATIVGKSENDRPVAPGPPAKRVSPVKTVRSAGACRHTAPGACPGVCSTVQVGAGDGEDLAVGQVAVRGAVRVGEAPQRQVVGVQQDRRAGGVGQGGGGADVVVVGVGADDGAQGAAADGLGDRLGVVCGVDDEDLDVVADDPHVVLHVPGAAVEARTCRP